MTRESGANLTELQSPAIRPARLVKLLGRRYTDHYAPVTYKSETYYPFAFSISGYTETNDLSAQQITLTFSTAEAVNPPDPAADAIPATQTNYRGAVITISNVLLDEHNTPIADSQCGFVGLISALNPKMDLDSSQIEIIAQDWMATLSRPGGLRFNSSDQQSRPGCSTDTAFDHLPKQKGRQITWMGAKTPSARSAPEQSVYIPSAGYGMDPNSPDAQYAEWQRSQGYG